MIFTSRTAAAATSFNSIVSYSATLLPFHQTNDTVRCHCAPSVVHQRQQQQQQQEQEGQGQNSPFFLVAALKSSAASLRRGEPLHALAIKTGLARANLYVRNSLLNLYAKCSDLDAIHRLFYSAPTLRDVASWNIALAAHAKCGLVDDARDLFGRMPRRDHVSFTTMIMALAQSGRHVDALAVFRAMIDDGVTPNEVTLASVISSCTHVPDAALRGGRMIHSVAVKCGLDEFVLVGTNLVHAYAVCSQMEDSRTIFEGMSERNTVTWNVMLNGYCKGGFLHLAEELFEGIPLKDLVSWSTMIDGYLRCDRLELALKTYRDMLRNSDARPNEVLAVALVSACSRHSFICEGQQLHAIVFKTGLDCHTFVQATLIHYYGACGFTDLARLQFESGCKSHVSSWNALLAGLLKNNKVDEATELFNSIPKKDVVSWSTLISGYVQKGLSHLALELFQEMQLKGCEPNEITMVSVLSAVADSGTLNQGKWIHDCITRASIPLTENLSASLIDMYAKCGSIGNALQVFDLVKKSTSVSPWNAIICGLAVHGYADMALSIFSDMQKAKIKPNAITFLGILSACCHNGYIADGRYYFDAMRRDYHIEPTIKHYGCMVDLLCRASCLEEAEYLIKTMSMEADVMIWGSMLAAARACGNVKIGEQAAENLARLEPTHGASRILLSNIYADAGKWSEAFLVRTAMQSNSLKKLPGCSGIT